MDPPAQPWSKTFSALNRESDATERSNGTSYTAANANTRLNRYCDVFPNDQHRVRLVNGVRCRQ